MPDDTPLDVELLEVADPVQGADDQLNLLRGVTGEKSRPPRPCVMVLSAHEATAVN
jgi:hypothetical protein